MTSTAITSSLQYFDGDRIVMAQPTDIPQIVSFGYNSLKENELKGFGMSPSFNKTTEYITKLVLNTTVITLRDEIHPSLLDGVFTFDISSTWWSDEPILISSLFYIKKDKRNYKNASKILNAAKEYAIMVGMPLVLDLVTNTDTERKNKLFKKLGFVEVGSFFIFTPSDVKE